MAIGKKIRTYRGYIGAAAGVLMLISVLGFGLFNILSTPPPAILYRS